MPLDKVWQPDPQSLTNDYFRYSLAGVQPVRSNLGPTVQVAASLPSTPATPSLAHRALNSVGLIDDQGQLLGLNDKTLAGLGSAFNMGKGLFDMYNNNKMFSLAKDYYGQQMRLQNEQAQMARDEAKRVANVRDSLNVGYRG